MFSPGALLSIHVDSIVFCPTTATKAWLQKSDLVVFLGAQPCKKDEFSETEDELNICLLTRLGVLKRRVAGRNWEKWFRQIAAE